MSVENLHKFLNKYHSDRLNQIESFRVANFALAVTLGFLTINSDKPGVWIGLGIGLADYLINDYRLEHIHNETISDHQKIKNEINNIP